MIRFDHVTKVFPGGTLAVDDLSLEIEKGETLVLLGTSGSGKTTSMKMINRLIEPSSGTIYIDGIDVTTEDPIRLRRKIGYAIQHIGLFTHMTIAENVGVVPRLLCWPADRIDDRVDRLLEMVGLQPDAFRDRYPAQLSGGQRQRVGVARALAADPPIILMDEPFGALDPITREQLQNEFLELNSQIGKTIVFVTHDVFEAVKMGDRIALMDSGRIRQVDEPRNLVENPADDFVDQFLGQHRFQLALLTRTIAAILPAASEWEAEASTEKPDEWLRARDCLLTGLDLFKQTHKDELPVYAGAQCIGRLTKRRLLEEIGQVLAETGGVQ